MEARNFSVLTIERSRSIPVVELKSTYSYLFRMTKNKKYKKNWSSSDIKILVWIVAKFCEKNKIKDSYGGIVTFHYIKKKEDWETISSLIPGTTPEPCMFKWLGLKKSKVREEKWQKEE
jgi:hypothetical protein